MFLKAAQKQNFHPAGLAPAGLLLTGCSQNQLPGLSQLSAQHWDLGWEWFEIEAIGAPVILNPNISHARPPPKEALLGFSHCITSAVWKSPNPSFEIQTHTSLPTAFGPIFNTWWLALSMQFGLGDLRSAHAREGPSDTKTLLKKIPFNSRYFTDLD